MESVEKVVSHRSKIDHFIMEMLNPILYIKPLAGIDEYSLFKRLKIEHLEDFFEMPKNSLVISGSLTNEDREKIYELYDSLIFPKLILIIGEDDSLLELPTEKKFFLEKGFTEVDFSRLAEEVIRGDHA